MGFEVKETLEMSPCSFTGMRHGFGVGDFQNGCPFTEQTQGLVPGSDSALHVRQAIQDVWDSPRPYEDMYEKCE